MRQLAVSTATVMVSLAAKARLIFVFMVAAVGALIWADQYTRGVLG